MPQINIDIADHERDAMWQLVFNARGLASTLRSDPHSVKLRVWAQMVEDVLQRMEANGERNHQGA